VGRISAEKPGTKSSRPMPMSTATSDFRLVCGVVCARLVAAPTLAVTSASGSSPESSKALTSRNSCGGWQSEHSGQPHFGWK